MTGIGNKNTLILINFYTMYLACAFAVPYLHWSSRSPSLAVEVHVHQVLSPHLSCLV